MPTPPTNPSPDPDGPRRDLFFAELLPALDGESAADTEARVRLELETSAPLPVDKLAYGWVRLASREPLFYAAPRERLPAHDPFAAPGAVLPPRDSVLLPDGVSEADFAGAQRDLYADLRARPELFRLRERAVADRLLSRVTPFLKYGALVALVLLLAAGALAATRAVREARLAAEAPALKSARDRLSLLMTLDRFESPARSVFDALALVNPHRPETVAFTRVAFADNRELTLEGRSTDAAAVNRMADALRAGGLFASADIQKLEASGGRTTFRLRLIHSHWPKFADAPTEVAPAPAAPAPTPAS